MVSVVVRAGVAGEDAPTAREEDFRSSFEFVSEDDLCPSVELHLSEADDDDDDEDDDDDD